MDIDTNERRAEPRSPQPRRGALDIVVAALLVLLGIVCLSYSLQRERQKEANSRQFIAAPVCDGRSVDAANCRLNALMMVTDKWDGSTTKTTYHYLDLRTRSGSTYEVRMGKGNLFWDAASKGQIVGTQRWHDEVVSLSAGSMRTITSAYPGPRRGEIHYFFSGSSGISLALFVSFFVFVIIKAARGQ